MKSRWDEAAAAACGDDPVARRVYSSRLLGADQDLVMHGGGNTSVKATVRDFFGDPVDVLHVKGSGWDLATIEAPGFPAVRLAETQRLATLEALSDIDMARQLRSFMLDPGGPSPSVEAILHAILPARYVDHTHADAVVTLTNTPDGDALTRELYPDCLVLPYVMPGFVLSKQVFDAIQGVDLDAIAGIILLHHGVFTWGEDARTAYEQMIELVDRAERKVAEDAGDEARGSSSTGGGSGDAGLDRAGLQHLARIRRAVSMARGTAQLARIDTSADAVAWASRMDVADLATRGPITPDHVIRTKRIPVVIGRDPAPDVPEVAEYAGAYAGYFADHQQPGQTMLDPAPRAAVWRGRGTIAFGTKPGECRIIDDIARHTRRAIQIARSFGGWTALSPAEIFELEYWSLEQAKLARGSGAPPPHAGKVAVVTGARGGIGRATALALAADGASVVGLDIASDTEAALAADGMLGIQVDVANPDSEAVAAAIDGAVRRFGGIDIVVANAGIFRAGERIEDMDDATWDDTLAVNVTSVQRLLRYAAPYLRLGVGASVVVVGSRNVTAPGPGAAAYSASKAALTQLARVAALELAADGVRVNIIHPDAVFDTGVWTDEALAASASRYGMTVDEYKARNLLGATITAADVGRMISAVAGPTFAATTGAQIPIDGGNDRVI